MLEANKKDDKILCSRSVVQIQSADNSVNFIQ